MSLTLNIVAGKDKETTTVSAHGEVQHVITDTEINSFQLNEDSLKNAVAKSFGKKPTDVFLKSPTPWNDLYKTYGWPQVKTILRPVKTEILSLGAKPLMIGSQEYVNDTDQEGTYDVKVTAQVADSVEESWSNSNSVSLSQSISYTIGFIEGETSLSYEHTWGQTKTEKKEVTIGQSSGITLIIPAHSKRLAELNVNQGTLSVRITYEARLEGVVAVNYGDPYKGHHFWALGVNGVMKPSNLPLTQTIVEDMHLDFYSNVSIKVVNG